MIPKVSISVVTYNSKKYLKCCLDSILQQNYPDWEVFLVDNNSTDGSVDLVKNSYADEKIKIISNNKNLGYAGGHNIGISKSDGKYVLCLNPDIILDKDYLKNLVKYLEQNQKVGAAQGRILKFKYGEPPQKTNTIDSLGIKASANHRFVELGGETDSPAPIKPTAIFGVSGAAPIFRRQALETIKFDTQYFDKTFHSYKEDIDISWRLRHAGWWCNLVPSAVAWHDRWETGSSSKAKSSMVIKKRGQKGASINYYSYRNHILLNLKNEFFANFLIFSPFIAWYELKKLIYLLLRERKTLRAWVDIFKLFSLTWQQRRDILNGSKVKPSEMRRWF